MQPCLADAFDPRRNSLNALRLLFAGAVLVSHAWPLGGFEDELRLGGGFFLGDWSVAAFFAISGWLIMGSRLSTGVGSYLRRRVLRIYPAYLVCLVLVAFAFAPLAGRFGPGSWDAADALRYLASNVGLQQRLWGIGDTLSSVPFEDTWNGSLWTLFYEFLCYVLVAAMVSVSRRHVLGLTVAVLSTCVGVQAAALWGGAGLPELVDDGTRLAAPFFAGSLLYLLRHRVSARSTWALGAGVALVAVAVTGASAVLGGLPLAYLCIWAGARLPLTGVGRRNDFSYGLYIYAFPVQQALVLMGAPSLGLWIFILLAFALTAPLAVASWFLVERPALRRKGGRPAATSRGDVPAQGRPPAHSGESALSNTSSAQR